MQSVVYVVGDDAEKGFVFCFLKIVLQKRVEVVFVARVTERILRENHGL